jgi:xylan 1,4-beta-xylosidase
VDGHDVLHFQAMSQWALSSTFEELGVVDYVLKEGYMGWGMLIQGIATPSFNTYKLLHALGSESLPHRRACDGCAARR